MPEKKSSYRGFTEAQAKAHKRYMQGFVEVKVRMTPEEREAIKAHAQSRGESVNGFLGRAIRETMERDNAEDEADSLSLLREYENDPDPEKNQAFPLEDCKREWGLSGPRSESL